MQLYKLVEASMSLHLKTVTIIIKELIQMNADFIGGLQYFVQKSKH